MRSRRSKSKMHWRGPAVSSIRKLMVCPRNFTWDCRICLYLCWQRCSTKGSIWDPSGIGSSGVWRRTSTKPLQIHNFAGTDFRFEGSNNSEQPAEGVADDEEAALISLDQFVLFDKIELPVITWQLSSNLTSVGRIISVLWYRWKESGQELLHWFVRVVCCRRYFILWRIIPICAGWRVMRAGQPKAESDSLWELAPEFAHTPMTSIFVSCRRDIEMVQKALKWFEKVIKRDKIFGWALFGRCGFSGPLRYSLSVVGTDLQLEKNWSEAMVG